MKHAEQTQSKQRADSLRERKHINTQETNQRQVKLIRATTREGKQDKDRK